MINSLFGIENKVVIVTGAGGRIGNNASLSILEAGGRVLAVDIDLKTLLNLKKKANNKNIQLLEADITKVSGIQLMINQAINSFGGIDALIHSAYPHTSNWGVIFEDLDQKSLNQNLSLQLGGAIMVSQQILDHFKKNGGGSLIHIASIQGVQAPKFNHYEGTQMSSPIEYTAIKAGVIAMTKWLAKYHRNCNIRVNCISPGGILDNQPNSFLLNYRESCTNIGMLNPTEISGAILFLLSESSKAINGQNIIIDDGWTL